jgi:hypothetical protein
MKMALYILALGLAIAIGFTWGKHQTATVIALDHEPQQPVSQYSLSPKSVPPRPASFLVQSEWQEYHNDREKVLQQNSELAAEYKTLMEKANAQQNALDAAMIKADPEVAPIVAKLEGLRERNSGLHAVAR